MSPVITDTGHTSTVIPGMEEFYRLQAQRFLDQIKPPFRGSITDYARTIWLGSGYIGSWADTNLCRNCGGGDSTTMQYAMAYASGKRCRHFEIDTARHLAGPFAAIQDPNVRVVMVLKAAQTAGSLTWDMAVHWLLVHSEYMRIKVLLDSDDKARKYCLERFMDTLKANPDIAPLLPSGVDRFNATNTEIRLLNGKTIFVGGLNDSNASSLPADVMILDEGWLHQADGLMKKAFNRTKQTKNKKIIVVGQAGAVDDDQDVIWRGLHRRVPLTWACPACGYRQPYELHKQRPKDFCGKLSQATMSALYQPRAQALLRGEYSAVTLAQIADELKKARETLPKVGSYCGFHVPNAFHELNTPEDIKAAAAAATIECFSCGFHIPDTWEMRQALNKSYDQEYRVRTPDGILYTPENYEVGFWHPDPASMFVPFRDTMQEFIEAWKAHKEKGNLVPLRDFYLARWAQAWQGNPDDTRAEILSDDYDPNTPNPDIKWLVLLVDWQDELTYCWYSIHGIAKDGRTWQLKRGSCGGEAELAKMQAEHKIPDQRVFMDAGHNQEKLVEMCSRHRHISRSGRYVCWQLFKGSKYHDFARVRKHKGQIIERYRHPISDPKIFPVRQGNVIVSVNLFNFSNLLVSDMAQRYRDNEKCPACKMLPHSPDDPPVDSELHWKNQLQSEHKITVLDKSSNLKVERWVLKKQHTPNHAWDLLKELCAFLLKTGIAQSGFKDEQSDNKTPEKETE